MHREARRVPTNWEHPRDEQGNLIPLLRSFTYTKEEIQEGLEEGWLIDIPPYYGCNVMPQWPEAERAHYQMYEATTEGTPISPVMKTPEELARWLADSDETVFGDRTTGYDSWLDIIYSGRQLFPRAHTPRRDLPKEYRRIISGAYGKPKRVSVIDLLDGSIAGWEWAKPSEHGPFYTLIESAVDLMKAPLARN